MICWRQIEGTAYEASAGGLVRRKGARQPLTQYLRKDGYLHVVLCIDRKGKNFLAHRLVCSAFHGPPPTRRHETAHRNGIKHDNRSRNLRWATPKENGEDNVRLGRQPRGEAHGSARLTDAQVTAIRKRAAMGERHMDLSAEFGVSQSTVSVIVSRRRWTHI